MQTAYNSMGMMSSYSYGWPQGTWWNGTYEQMYTYLINYDGAYRPVNLTGEGLALVDLVQYNAAGAMTSFERRDTQTGVVTNTYQFNSLYQMTNQTVTRGGTTLQNLSYAYPATQNNGQIASQTNTMSGETVEYQYDELNRLISAATPGGGGWGLSFAYDGFGNRTNQAVTKGSGPMHSVAINPANNRISTSGYSYDANGNMTAMPLMTASYDVANRMVESVHQTAGTHRYGYNHANQRVFRHTSVPNQYGYDRRFSLYGLAGELLIESDWMPICQSGCGAPPQGETLRYVYFGGRKMFASAYMGPLKATTPNRLESRSEHFPYGEQKGAAPPDNDKDYFTTYRRDESGLDYAWNRYYSPTMGRFTTADPYSGSAVADDPQSWNRYAYVQGNPVNAVDPTGLIIGPIGGSSWNGGWGDPYDWTQCLYNPWNSHSSWAWLCGSGNQPWSEEMLSVLGPWHGQQLGEAGGGTGSKPTEDPNSWINDWIGTRLEDQTFWQCVDQQGESYSIAGVFEMLHASLTDGARKDMWFSPAIQLVAGNAINSLVLGGLMDAGLVAAHESPTVASQALGKPLSHGRRTTDIMSLNLKGTPGGPPLALSSSNQYARVVLSKAGNVLNLGMSFSVRLAIDAGMTGALLINCGVSAPPKKRE